ncbi:hypothetical protein B0T24DRAFT_616224 [Lasiosphaeria ovina]|uniref:Uncharacterized protein n=1 Tax=Lasiosphaeria ovina TaxID=92902 RepID=A0AAE0NFS8_9PEZI|nr:hypothetical protein B0T24DRAFT_616224 [Lasiosphaeria ovina]
MDCLSSHLRTEVPLDHKPRTQRNPWTPKILPETETSHVRTRGDDYLDWYALMTFYSGKQLSFPEDKLPAVSGLAHKMLQTHNDTYLAGLWKGDLCRGLMWWPMNNIRAAEYTTYVAPSWSWAAHNGGVTWASQGPTGFRQEMELLDVVVSPSGADPHGRLQSGYLDVVAKTLPWRDMFDGPLVYTAYMAEEGGRKSGPRAQVRHDSIKFGWSTADNVLALRVGTTQLGEGLQTASGLLVQTVPPTDQVAHGASKWRRVGWFKCDSSKFTSAIGKTFVLV